LTLNNPFSVWIDGVQAGRLLNGAEVLAPVSPGAHRIQVRWAPPVWNLLIASQSKTLEFLVEPGQVVHFSCDLVLKRFEGRILLRRVTDPPVSAPSDPGIVDTRIVGVTETTRIEEWLGEDVRLINNRAGPAPVTRSLKASREWTRTLTLDESRRQTLGRDVEAHLLWLSAKGGIETELQRTLSLAIGSTHLFEEEFSVTIPERTAVRIVLGWKRIWQCGDARVLLPDRSMHIVPYRVVVSVTFDQKIQEITGLPDA
jgi:hypothetical protein